MNEGKLAYLYGSIVDDHFPESVLVLLPLFYTEGQMKPSETSRMELFVIIVNG